MSKKSSPITETAPPDRIKEIFGDLMASAEPTRSSSNEAVVTAIPVAQDLWDLWKRLKEHGPLGDVSPLDRLRVDLAQAIYTNINLPPAFDQAASPDELEDVYYALEARMLCEDSGSNQAGLGSLIGNLRQAVIESTSLNTEPGKEGHLPRKVNFMANGLGYRRVPLVATFAPVGQTQKAGHVDLAFADEQGNAGIPVGHMAIGALTAGVTTSDAFPDLARLHRFGRYGEGMLPFGEWFTSDGHGRELTAAIIAGFVNRVMPDKDNGMGGTSPCFALTQEGVEFVLSHPALATVFEHFNNIEASTATLVDGNLRVPFDTDTGAILGRLDASAPYMPAYIIRPLLSDVAPGNQYARDKLGYLLTRDLQHHREQQVRLEEAENVPDFIELTEDEFEDFGLQCGSASGTSNYEFHEVQGLDVKHVWTILEAQDDGEPTQAVPGIQHAFAIGYAVTEKPWPHENVVAVYMSADEPDNSPRP